MTPWTTDEVIRRIVRREVPGSERGTISTLNDLPEWMVEEVRSIARESLVSAVRYLRFYVARPYAASAEDFIEDVLLKGQDARSWRVQDCVWIPWPPVRASTVDVQQYLERFKDMEGERWFRVRPRAADHFSDYTPGIVGLVRRGVRYWHTSPDGTGQYPLASPEDVEFVDSTQLEPSVRRWIAHRMAWWAREYLDQSRASSSTVTADGILRAVAEVEQSPVTEDARLAADALAHEAHAFGDSPEFPQQAGFLGPDEWYQAR